MSRLIAQIMLAILLFPLAGLLYFSAFVVYMETRSGWGPDRETAAMFVAGLVTWGFIACYWLALWRKGVRWTGDRSLYTTVCFVVAAIAGAVLGMVMGGVTNEDAVGAFVGTTTAPLLWQVGTILVWRETAAERAERLSQRGMAGGVLCPTCGYNMSGLKGTRCPECGSEFTLDALIAGQPNMRQAEVER